MAKPFKVTLNGSIDSTDLDNILYALENIQDEYLQDPNLSEYADDWSRVWQSLIGLVADKEQRVRLCEYISRARSDQERSSIYVSVSSDVLQ